MICNICRVEICDTQHICTNWQISFPSNFLNFMVGFWKICCCQKLLSSWTKLNERTEEKDYIVLHTWSVFWWRSVNNKLRWVILTFIMLLKNCRSRLERKQQILSRFVMPGVSFIGYNGTSTFIKHTAPKLGVSTTNFPSFRANRNELGMTCITRNS